MARKGVNGRAKGAKFERDIAKAVTKWTGMVFKRTPMSGGWAKTGDITPVNPADMVKFGFNLELKKREQWDVCSLFQLTPKGKLVGPLQSWWKQCVSDGKRSKRIPVLVFTKNRTPIFCLMTKMHFCQVGLQNRLDLYHRLGKYRVFLWKDLMAVPYPEISKNVTVGK